MVTKQILGTVDYIVICVSLLISISIGIVSRKYAGQQKTAKEYILAGRRMTKLPVVLSVVVTLVSPSTLLSTPVEVYLYGYELSLAPLTFPIGMFLASWIFIPVYFRCGVSTIYEIFYMVISLYGAVLALSAVTDLSLEISLVSLGAICTFYSSLGGLRAVLWTDVFQAALITICVISLYVVGFKDGGGFVNVYNNAKGGGRLEFFDFRLDFTKRHDIWACMIRGILYAIAFYGTNQVEVQRVLSLSTAERARSTLHLTILPASAIFFLTHIYGIVLYSVYYHCDPILNVNQTGLSRYDQIVPAYIVNRFNSIPGLTGVCIAGIFSASLSTMSSCLNSASTVTVIDFIKPFYKKGTLSDLKTVFLVKLFSVIYGGVCIGLSFCFLEVKSLVQLLNIMLTSLEGPMLAVFLTGVLTRKASDKCVSFSLVTSYLVMSWIGFGTLLSGYVKSPLPLSTDECPSNNVSLTSSFNFTSALKISSSTQIPEESTFVLYRISFMWYALMGFLLTQFLIILSVLVTGWKNNVIPKDSICLSPVTRFWLNRANLDKPLEMKQGKETNDIIPSTSQM
ncbi:putative sodium-dependent multivitamin transporter isoform X2 [Parasteatoda tepidariorum]|uniref:putative sodium-dependent multivitamin transporter isoform X2 n=1 Tax=Parasteatoda tepidariorum TaxID=114398 RepID=UPI0039BD0108